MFAAYAERGLSFTDCISIALLKLRGIDPPPEILKDASEVKVELHQLSPLSF